MTLGVRSAQFITPSHDALKHRLSDALSRIKPMCDDLTDQSAVERNIRPAPCETL